jgi:hypothetical protein
MYIYGMLTWKMLNWPWFWGRLCGTGNTKPHHRDAFRLFGQCCQVLSRLVRHFSKNTPLFDKNTPLLKIFKKFRHFSVFSRHFLHNNFKSKNRIIL